MDSDSVVKEGFWWSWRILEDLDFMAVVEVFHCSLHGVGVGVGVYYEDEERQRWGILNHQH
jgi:hypothetical protein